MKIKINSKKYKKKTMWWLILITLAVIVMMSLQKVEPFYVDTAVKIVRITNNGAIAPPLGRDLQIAQLCVYNKTNQNVAGNQPTQSSGATHGTSERTAVDGTLSARPFPSIYHGGNTGTEFFQINLQVPHLLSKVVFYNRSECCGERALSYILTLIDGAGNVLETIPFTVSDPVITFNLNGLMGPKGEQGLPGAAGAKGEQGLPGAAGARGEQGLPGAAGANGAAGAKGDAGELGEAGIQGVPGKDALSEGPIGFQTTSLGTSIYAEL